jgi:hypothetical protein
MHIDIRVVVVVVVVVTIRTVGEQNRDMYKTSISMNEKGATFIFSWRNPSNNSSHAKQPGPKQPGPTKAKIKESGN